MGRARGRRGSARRLHLEPIVGEAGVDAEREVATAFAEFEPAVEDDTPPLLLPEAPPSLPRRLWRKLTAWRQRPDPFAERPVFRPLPRRASLVAAHTQASAPTMMRKVVFSATTWHVFERLMVWMSAAVTFFAGNLWDWLLRRHSRERSAKRLRRAFEVMGGTVIKIGQQIGMRVDLLPFEYANELSNMLDKVPAFPSELALEAVQRMLRARGADPSCRLEDVFERFDPSPIGAASVSCVYQAILKNGDRVAVKVRRPNIGPVFMADCQALSWLMRCLEFFTIVRPGLSKNLVVEFRDMLLDELDFVKEARHAELFRRRVKRTLKYASAPRVYFELTSDEVLVTEFVSGIWLSEVLSAVEQKDARLLAFMQELKIDPRRVAKRLLAVNQFGIFENILFHADPHPGNVVIRPNNKLVFIDFGACGSYTHKERYVWRQLMQAQANEDISQMVQCALAVLEPLPPIDVDEFSKRLEGVFWQDLYAFKSKHSEWWERTSARIWLSFLGLSREFDMPMNLNTLRMIRSTLLYDTIAARLYSKISSYKEHKRYNERAGRRAHKRVARAAHRLALRGPRPSFYLRAEQLVDMANRVVYHAQRFLDAPPFQFVAAVEKSVFAVATVFKMIFMIAGGAAVLMLFYCLLHITYGLSYAPQPDGSPHVHHWLEILRNLRGHARQQTSYTVGDSFYEMMRNREMLLYTIMVVITHLRRIGFRLSDRKTP
jgi:ubiquinone biosynthesis protein